MTLVRGLRVSPSHFPVISVLFLSLPRLPPPPRARFLSQASSLPSPSHEGAIDRMAFDFKVRMPGLSSRAECLQVSHVAGVVEGCAACR